MEPLIIARVDAVTFGVAHFQLRLSNDAQEFSVSTSADVSFEHDGERPIDFREAKSSIGLVSLIGAELRDFVVHEPGRLASLLFDGGRQVRAWWPGKIYDNLFVVRREGTDEWWVVE